MQLQHINIDELTISPLNVRKHKPKQVSDLMQSIERLGIIQPLLVRPIEGGYEIVAGQRRFNALQKILAQDDTDIDPDLASVPCVIMQDGDNAIAIEASLTENTARLPMDEIDQYKAFAALIKQGLSVTDIADQFGISEKRVTQRLAIANLIAPILTAYRQDKIPAETVRLLTMATKAQQRDWLALYKDDEAFTPHGFGLKKWLFGGAQIKTDSALFDLEAYQGAIVSDLFGDDAYFSDSTQFWTLQTEAINTLKATYLKQGWSEVIVLDVGEYFPCYEYVDTDKEDGGKVYIAMASNGEVTCYEGQLSRKEIKKRDKSTGEAKDNTPTVKPEMTKPLQNYCDLHRHSAVRLSLLAHPALAMRVAVAQIIAGSSLWAVYADPQKAKTDAIADSLASNKAQDRFAEERRALLSLLNLGGEASDSGAEPESVTPQKGDWQPRHDVHALLQRLLELDDDTVTRVFTFVVAESLPCGAPFIDVIGKQTNIGMGDYWQPDEAFFDLLRNKKTVNTIIGEIADQDVATARASSTLKEQKAFIKTKLGVTTDGDSTSGWLPRYMAFPAEHYQDAA